MTDFAASNREEPAWKISLNSLYGYASLYGSIGLNGLLGKAFIVSTIQSKVCP
jgi:hypothetical protein